MEPTTVTAAAASAPNAHINNATEKMLIGLIAGLIVGGAGGWYIGTMMSLNQGAQEKRAALQQQQQLQGSATVNTLANPLDDVQANPYDVKVNPFE